MAISEGERGAVLDKVATVLREQIHDQFVDFYAAAVSLTERQPDQVNNEIRNALTHLSRSLAVDDYAQANSEIDRACNHIDRAMRDAIKLAVFELRDRIHSACAEIRLVHGVLDTPFLVRRENLTDQRKALIKLETEGSKDVMAGFVQLFIDARSLEDDLIKAYDVTYGRISKAKAWTIWFRRQIKGIVLGLAVGIMGSLIYTILVPDQESFGKKIRDFIFHKPPPSIATPGTLKKPVPTS